MKNILPELLGAIFAVLLMGFAYAILSFFIEITSSISFQLMARKVAEGEFNLLPATVVVAIALFALREFFDFYKKRSDKKRNIEAIKLLIADEIEKIIGHSFQCLEYCQN